MDFSSAHNVGDLLARLKRQMSIPGLYVRGNLCIEKMSRAKSGQCCYASLYDTNDTNKFLRLTFWQCDSEFANLVDDNNKEIVVWGRFDVYRSMVSMVVSDYAVASETAVESCKEKNIAAATKLGFFEKQKTEISWNKVERVHLLLSLDGVVRRDIENNMRAGKVELVVHPVKVQGEACVPTNVRAIREINRNPDLSPETDVILLTRGGGSQDDLKGYDEVGVLGAIFESTLPVCTALGHTTDTPLACLVADRNYDTPTKFATQVSLEMDQNRIAYEAFLSKLESLLYDHVSKITNNIQTETQRLSRSQTCLKDSVDGKLRCLESRIEFLLNTETFFVRQGHETEETEEIKTIEEFERMVGKPVSIPFCGGYVNIVFPTIESFESIPVEKRSEIRSVIQGYIRCALDGSLVETNEQPDNETDEALSVESYDNFLESLSLNSLNDVEMVTTSVTNHILQDLLAIKEIDHKLHALQDCKFEDSANEFFKYTKNANCAFGGAMNHASFLLDQVKSAKNKTRQDVPEICEISPEQILLDPNCWQEIVLMDQDK